MRGYDERKTPEQLRREAMARIKSLAHETYNGPYPDAFAATMRQAEDILLAVRDWAMADDAANVRAPRWDV